MNSADLDFEKKILSGSYDAFNKRDIDGVLINLDSEVDWPNGMEGGIEHGHDAVRKYWTRQWLLIDPHVYPLQYERIDDGRINVTVHQVVRDLSGNLLADQHVHHIYEIENGLIQSMEIK